MHIADAGSAIVVCLASDKTRAAGEFWAAGKYYVVDSVLSRQILCRLILININKLTPDAVSRSTL